MTPAPKPEPRQPKAPKRLQRRTPLRASAKPKDRPSDGRWSSLPDRKTRLPKATKPIKRSRGRRKCYQHLEHPDFRAYVRLQPCVVTGKRIGDKLHRCNGRIEFSHYENQGRGTPDFGHGFPLCTSLHTDNKDLSWHRGGPKSFARRFAIDVPAVCRKLAIDYLVHRYGRDWEMIPEAVELAATLPPEQAAA